MHYILFVALTLNGRFLQSSSIEFSSQEACEAGASEYRKFVREVGDLIHVDHKCIAKGAEPQAPARR